MIFTLNKENNNSENQKYIKMSAVKYISAIFLENWQNR